MHATSHGYLLACSARPFPNLFLLFGSLLPSPDARCSTRHLGPSIAPRSTQHHSFPSTHSIHSFLFSLSPSRYPPRLVCRVIRLHSSLFHQLRRRTHPPAQRNSPETIVAVRTRRRTHTRTITFTLQPTRFCSQNGTLSDRITPRFCFREGTKEGPAPKNKTGNQ